MTSTQTRGRAQLAASAALFTASLALAQSGVIVSFNSGAGVQADSTVVDPIDGASTQYSFVSYSEGGVDMMVTPSGATVSVGNYYGVGDGVVHGHWIEEGGNMETLRFELASGEPFDLNYYRLTSNTEIGGGPATGNEDTYIIASVDGTTESFRQKLPSEDWGTVGGGGDGAFREIYLGPEFDGIRAFWFDSEGGTFCFGMDEFYVNLAAPTPITDDPIVVGSGTVDDAISGSSSARAIPTLGGAFLFLLSAITGIAGIRVLRKRD